MKQIVLDYRTGKLAIQEVPMPTIKPGGVLVRNVNSLISSGTEKLMISLARKNLLAKAKARPDLVRKVVSKAKQEGLIEAYRQAAARLEEPVPLGYSSAGEVIELGRGVNEFHVGERVACAGHKFASHSEIIFVPKNLCAKIPDNVNFEDASFVNLGAIAIHGVRTGDPAIGSKAAIIGLGLLGQIAIQILKASGVQVFGIDIDEGKVKLAKQLGADEAGVIGRDNVLEMMKNFSCGIGVDIVYIFASTYSSQPIELAGEIARERARVVIIGEITINIPRKIYYEKELEVIVSRSSGPGIYDEQYERKGIDYPIAYVRWTLKRNLEEFLRLVGEGRVKLGPLVTHRFKIDEALKAYDVILGKTKENHLGILLEYSGNEQKNRGFYLEKTENVRETAKKINVGVIGGGLHSRGTLLPILKRIPMINLSGIADEDGLLARFLAEKFGFSYCMTDYKEILNDKDINAVVIATPHNLHAKMLGEALAAGKDVFIEKPLALNEAELREITKIYKKRPSRVMVGFNRRFSPFSVAAKESFSWFKGSRIINCRVNVGYIPINHWTHDPEIGGGNIIGEVCHFVDLIQFFSESFVSEVYAKTLSGDIGGYVPHDNVEMILKTQNGSLASIVYTTAGNRDYPRERIEIFGGGAVAVIDNFKSLVYVQGGKEKKKKNLFNIAKGHQEELFLFFKALQEGKDTPVKFEDYLVTTLTTLKMMESIQKGIPLSVDIGALI